MCADKFARCGHLPSIRSRFLSVLKLEFLLLFVIFRDAQSTKPVNSLPLLRWCVLGAKQEHHCWKLASAVKEAGFLNIACVRAAHPFQCMSHLNESIADMAWLTPEQIYAGGKRYSIRPLLYDAQPETGMFVEDAVVIVKNDREQFKHGLSDLKGKRLCLTGTSPENVQYQALVNVLFPLGYMNVAEGNCQDPLVSLAAHFSSSCIPGRWSLQEEKRQRFTDLCDRCHKVCTDEDYYASPEGAIRCLLATGADVAVTNSRAALNAELDESVYQLLCIQGGLKPMNQTCAWMNRKPMALVTGDVDNSLRVQWRKGLMQAFTRFDGSNYPWLYLFKPTVENGVLSDVYYSDTWDRYLGLVYIRSMETPFPATVCGHLIPLRWCVITPVQLEKCTQIAMAAESERLQPQIVCEIARSYAECKERLVHDWADMTSLLAEELYDSIMDMGFAPVAAEKYENGATDTYLVAVVRKGSNVTFSELRTSRSCHAGAFNTLSWNAPIVLLKEKNLLHMEHCEFAAAAQRFFWESCVPEIKDNLYEGKLNIGPLCAACGGIEKCGRESRFHGEDGALECLSYKYGDIAFVTNRTLLSKQNLAAAQDFELFCLDGSKAPVTQYESCHWLRVPGKYLVVAGKRFSADDRLKVTRMLMEVQKSYGLTVEPGKFSIFPTPEDPDTIFSPQTRELLPVVPKQTIEETLGKDYATVYRYMHYCKNGFQSRTAKPATWFMLLSLLVLLVRRM